jgi:hypothetical protein
METTLQKVRAKCIEANPVIGELADQKPWRICDECLGGGLVSDENGENTDACINCAGTGKVPNEGKKVLVQKRPIRLADVLLAIHKRLREDASTPVWAIDMAGEFFDQSTSDGSPIYLDVVWNLREDDLEKQPQETIEFIGRVLGIKQ